VTRAAKRKPLPSAPDELAQRLCDPGFTPRTADVDSIVSLLEDDALARAAERAVARLRSPALPVLLARFERALPPARARILRIIGRIAAQDGSPPAIEALVRALDDRDPKTRRNAAIAIGHLPGHGVEGALLRAWTRDERPEMRRSLASSLGKIGSTRALALLQDAARSEDGDLVRVAERAIMMIERTASRPAGSKRRQIESLRVAARPIDVIAVCRSGLEDLLAEELGSISVVTDVRVQAPSQVAARLRGSIRALLAARTMLSFRFPLPRQRLKEGATIDSAVARAVAGDEARMIFETWDRGAPRYRIAWADGGHRRGATWEAARAIAQAAPWLVNDPTDSTWQIVIANRLPFVDVAIGPRRLHDPRFSWRARDVPAASHPTIAAALARVSGARPDDIVWDPFVGSGAELIERSILGPCRSLIGSDTDDFALAAARENFATAGIRPTLQRADALTLHPPGVTLIVTNPPMGRRTSRVPGVTELLDRFVAHASRVLRPGGRLVWIAPWPARARKAAAQAGLQLGWAKTVDLGGFDAEMQRWNKPE